MPNKRKADKKVPVSLSLPKSQVAFLDGEADEQGVERGRSAALQDIIADAMKRKAAESKGKSK